MRNPVETIGHQQVDQIVHIGQRPRPPNIHRHLAVQFLGQQPFAVGRHFAGITIETLHLITIAAPQCGGQLHVAGTQIDNETTLHPGGRNDPGGFCISGGIRRGQRRERGGQQEAAHRQRAAED